MAIQDECRRIFTTPEYWIRGWARDAIREGRTELLGEASIVVLGGGFRLIPSVLGELVRISRVR